MVRLLLLALVLLAPLSVAAQQTVTDAPPRWVQLKDAEIADLARLTDSMTFLRRSQAFVLDNLIIASPEAGPVYVQLLTAFQAAQIEHWQFRAYLGKGGTENPSPKPTMTHEQWRAAAEFHRPRYRRALDMIAVLIDRAKDHHVDQAAYQDNLRRAKDIWLSQARTALAKMDPGLTWENPWPALRPDKTVETMVGPHGDFRFSVWGINRGINYQMDAYAGAIRAYRAGADPKVLRDYYTQSAAGLDDLDHAWALTYDVTRTVEEAAEDRFCRVLRVVKLKTVNAAKRYQAAQSVLGALVPPAYRELATKPADSWKHAVDVSTWQDMVFPESTRCASGFVNN